MEAREIINQQELDEFVGSQAKSQFLQSWLWGEFQRSQQNKVMRIGISDGGKIIGSAQLLVQTLPLGKRYWYCPRGPVVDAKLSIEKYHWAWKILLAEIVSRAEKQGAIFLKIEPPLEKYSRQLFDSLVQKYDIREVKFVQPPDSWYLKLDKSEKDLLASMRQKARYNMRLAERKGVTVRTTSAVDDFEIFWQLIGETASRDKFHSHSRAYYHDMYRRLVPTDFMKMFIAELEGKIIAANMVVWFGDTVTYVHGASSDETKNVMAPHLLQWRQIQAAKKEGYKYYDFWGVAPEGQEKHQWAGITRFKKSFGGQGISYLGAYDLILDKFWYRLYRTAKKIKI